MATIYYLYRDGYKREAGPVKGKMPRKVGTDVIKLEYDSIIVVSGRVPNAELYRELKKRKS